MAEEQMNRYRNTSKLQQSFYIVETGDTVTLFPAGQDNRPAGTVLAQPNSSISRASFMELVDEDVEVPADGRHQAVIQEGAPDKYDRQRAEELKQEEARMASQTQKRETQQSEGTTKETKTNPKLAK